jgi:hypothetical protein
MNQIRHWNQTEQTFRFFVLAYENDHVRYKLVACAALFTTNNSPLKILEHDLFVG